MRRELRIVEGRPWLSVGAESDADSAAFDAAVAAFYESTEHGVGSMVELLRSDFAAGRISADAIERLSTWANSDGSFRTAIDSARHVTLILLDCHLPRLVSAGARVADYDVLVADLERRVNGARPSSDRSAPPRFKPIVDAVVSSPDRPWDARSRATATTDAACVLESLLAEVGVEAAVAAVRAQGLKGDYRYVIEPLYNEALARRAVRNRAKDGGTVEAIDS